MGGCGGGVRDAGGTRHRGGGGAHLLARWTGRPAGGFPCVGRAFARGDPAVRGPRRGPVAPDVRRRVVGRVLLVGDAAGYVDAITGEGIAVAIASARVLVQALAAGQPERYEREWRSVSRSYRVITSGLLQVRAQPRLARCVVPVAARLPRVFGYVVNQLAG